jgi:Bcr/CflA subfamily drug resistance transporter
VVFGKSLAFFLVLMLLSVLGQFATEVYLPSMPEMATYLHVHINMIQLTIAVYVLGFAAGSLMYGTLSDKFGRKPILFACLLIGSLGSIVCCVSFTLDWLLIGRVIQGLGFSGVAVVTRSISKDISVSREQLAKIATLMGILNSSAIAFAPVIGGYIEKYMFWRMNFILLLLISVATTFLCWYKIPETNKNKRSLTLKIILQDYIDVLSNRQFLLYNVISTFTLSGVVAYQTVSSYLLRVKVGMSPESFGYTALFITAALIIGGVTNSYIMPRRGTEKMLMLGCGIYIIAGFIYVVTGLLGLINIYIIMLPIIIYMGAAGIVYPNCSSGAMSIFDTKAGTAASVYNCVQMVGATIGSVMVSIYHDTNQLPLGLMFTVIGLITLFFARKLQVRVIRKVTHI